MAIFDFSDIYGRAITAARRDSSLAADVTAAKNAVNEIQAEICDDGTEYDFLQVQGNQTASIGTESYSYTTIGTSLSTTVEKVIAVTWVGTTTPNDLLKPMPLDDYNRVFAMNPTLNGPPVIWTDLGDSSISLYPRPDANSTLRITVRKACTTLAADGDISVIPQGWRHRLLVAGAAAKLLRQEGGAEAVGEAERYEAEYEKWLEAFRTAHRALDRITNPKPEDFDIPAGLQGVSGSFLDLAQKAAKRGGGRWWFDVDITRAKEAINECYQALCDDGTDWDYLETMGNFNTAAATATYTYATIASGIGGGITVTDVLALRQTSATTLRGCKWDTFEKIVGLNATLTAASPELWTKTSDNQIVVYPTPTGIVALTSLVRKAPTTLSANTDVPSIPATWTDRILVNYAACKIAYGLGDTDRAERMNAAYEAAAALFHQAHGSDVAPTFPDPRPVEIPAGLKGTAGTFLFLAQQACHRAGMDVWEESNLRRAKECINAAYLASADTGEPWDFLQKEGQFTVSSAADTYSFSSITTALSLSGSSVTEILFLVVDTTGQGGELDGMSWVSLERMSASTQDGDSQGIPVAWTEWGDDRMRVWPKPDATYTLGGLFRLAPARMSADTDTPLIPDAWRERVLVPYAAYLLLRDKGDGGSVNIADRYRNEWESAYKDMRDSHATVRQPALRLASPTFGDDLPGGSWDQQRGGWWGD